MNIITPETQYEKISQKIAQKEKEKKAILQKISKARNKNNGEYPVYTIALFNESKNKLIDILQLQAERKKYSI